jgi:hypothetical protein
MQAAMKARTEVEEQHAAVKDLIGWQKSLASSTSKPKTESLGASPAAARKPAAKSSASHTYDKGYSKWDSFDAVSGVQSIGTGANRFVYASFRGFGRVL